MHTFELLLLRLVSNTYTIFALLCEHFFNIKENKGCLICDLKIKWCVHKTISSTCEKATQYTVVPTPARIERKKKTAFRP